MSSSHSTKSPAKKRAKTKNPYGDISKGGRAPATLAPHKSAYNLCDRLMKERGEVLLTELAATDCEGDNLKVWFTELANAMGNDSCVKSTGEEHVATTLTGYLEKAKDYLLVQYPNNEVLNDKEFFDGLYNKIPNIANRRQRKGKDETDAIKKIIPIFRKSMPENAIFMDPQEPVQEVSTDLLRICTSLWKSGADDAHMMRLTNNMLHAGDARGGEPKFLTCDKMYYEHRFHVIYGLWFQLKQTTTVPTCFTNDYEHPETCVEHSFAAFWCVENGLARGGNPYQNPKSAEARKASYVFQPYHGMNDSSVTQKVTARLKTLVPLSLKHLISSKGLRIGSSTEMAADPLVDFDQSIMRGGWSTGTSRDYCVWIVLCALLAPMMSLAGHPDPKAMPYPPRLNAIPFDQHATVQAFIRVLCIIDVPYFLPGDKLRPMLEECTAVLIMHFPYTIRKYSREDKLMTKMIESGLSAGLGTTPNDVIIKLREWGGLIKNDCDNQKSKPSDHREEILARLISVQRQQAANDAFLRERLTSTELKLDEAIAEMTSMKQVMESFMGAAGNDFGEIKGMLNQLLGGCGGTAEPRRISASPENLGIEATRTAVGNLMAATAAPTAATTAATATAAATMRNTNANANAASISIFTGTVPSQAAATPQQQSMQPRSVNNALWHNARVNSKATDDGISVSKVMEALYKMKNKPLSSLGRPCRFLKFLFYQPITSNNKAKYESAMTLVEALLTTKQRKIAIEGILPTNEAASAFFDLDEWVKKAAAAIQGKTKVNASRRASWIGIGGCVKEAKKSIHRVDMTEFIAGYIPKVEWDQLKDASDSAVFLGEGKTETFRQWVDSQLIRNATHVAL